MTVMEADISGGFVTGFPEVYRALEEQRAGFRALVADLEPDEWRRPSRCHLWTVHDVVRHVRDTSKLHLGLLHGDPSPFRPDDPFDNREAPQRWLAQTDGEKPNDTVRDLEQLESAELDALAACMEQGIDRTLSGPYGPIHWTVATAHVFWDTWIHECDITEPLNRPHLPTLREDLVAALYGLLVASIPATFAGHPLDTTVRLTTASGRPFTVHLTPRHAVLKPARPGDTTNLQGELATVVDSLAGRGQAPEAVLAGDPAQREPLTRLRTFMVPPA